MSKHGEDKEGCHEFKWGSRRNVGRPTNNHYYESFTYKGAQYSLYDCVYFYRTGDPETSIGELVNIYETPTHEKKLKVVWFFRPIEICKLLGNVAPLWNELFLASGEGPGLSNINPLEAIIGKCNVVCTSQDERNPQPSKEEVRAADYIFYRTFDVKMCTISDVFEDKIGGIKVEYYFNGKKSRSLSQSVSDKRNFDRIQKHGKLLKPGLQGADFGAREREVRLLNRDIMALNAPYVQSIKKRVCPAESVHTNMKKQTISESSIESNELIINTVRRLEKEPFENNQNHRKHSKPGLQGAGIGARGDQGCISNETTSRPKKSSFRDDRKDNEVQFNISRDIASLDASDVHSVKRRKIDESVHINSKNQTKSKSTSEANEILKNKVPTVKNEPFEISRRPRDEKKSWLKEQPWAEKLKRAEEKGTLVLLENLDPSFTSSDVEDIIWSALNEKVEARMIQQSTFSSPYYGKAFAIFKSKDKAESAMCSLVNRYLMLRDGRPLMARKGFINKDSENASFLGHIAISRFRPQQQRQEMEQGKEIENTKKCFVKKTKISSGMT